MLLKNKKIILKHLISQMFQDYLSILQQLNKGLKDERSFLVLDYKYKIDNSSLRIYL